MAERPPLSSFEERPPLSSFEEPQDNKLQRFLKNVTPAGPISGMIGLARTAGQAAQGARPDLLTNPENAIPEAVWGSVAAATGPRGTMPRSAYPEFDAVPPREPPRQLEYKGPPPKSKLEEAQLEAKRVAQRLRDTGQMPPESSGPPIEMPGAVTPPPESSLLPPQLVREFGAVRKGVELKTKLNPESVANLTAKEQALQAAIAPHIRSIDAVTQRTTAPIAALEAAVPSLSEALSTPGKAASVANWVRVYERAARAKFSPEAKASLGLATKNLNNNLGLDLTLEDVLKGP